MKVNDLLKWKRALNEIKFKHTELELIKEICGNHASDFQLSVERYCRENNINLGELNRKKGLKEASEQSKENNKAIEDKTNTTDSGEMALFENHPTEDAQPVDDLFVEGKDKDEMKKVFKALFKVLAFHLHPDRLNNLTEEEKEVRLEMFKQAKEALDKEDYFILLEMSERFNIRTPSNYRQQTRWMKARSKQIEQQILAERNTYNYVFSECETEQDKERIIKNFLRQLFGIL
jgi:hypothetical protein